MSKGQETEQLCARRENGGKKHKCFPALPVDLLIRNMKAAVAPEGSSLTQFLKHLKSLGMPRAWAQQEQAMGLGPVCLDPETFSAIGQHTPFPHAKASAQPKTHLSGSSRKREDKAAGSGFAVSYSLPLSIRISQ